MSKQVGKGSRLFWWLAATGIVVAICALVLLFRVPLALWVLRKDVLDPPTSGLVRRVVRSAGESAIPYLREGLDDPKERYAGYCGWELLRHWPKLGLEARDEFLV